MIDNTLKTIIRFVIYAIISVLICMLFFKHKEAILHSFQNIRPSEVLILALLQTPIIGLGGVAFYFFSIQNIQIKYTDAIGLSYTANLLNQILPYRPGMIYRYFFLKQKYQMSLGLFVCIMSLYFILTVLSGSLFALVGWWWGDLSIIHLYDFRGLLGLILFILLFGLLIRFSKKTKIKEKRPILHEKIQYIKQTLYHPKLLGINCLIFILIHSFIAVSLYYIYQCLHHTIPFMHCAFFSGILSLSSILYVTPGNIGINESILGAITQVIYQDFSIGLSASLLFRMTQWIPGIILGCFFGLLLKPQKPAPL